MRNMQTQTGLPLIDCLYCRVISKWMSHLYLMHMSEKAVSVPITSWKREQNYSRLKGRVNGKEKISQQTK